MTDFEKSIIEIAITVLISAVVSIITSYRTTKQELKKFPYEIQRTYADNLQQKRIQLYPSYFGLISELTKKVERRLIDKNYLLDWVQKFLKIDSEISIFLSGASANFAYKFYCGLEDLINQYYYKNELTGEDFYRKLNELRADRLETLLKIDIGVYIVEFDPKTGTQIIDYDTIDRLRDNDNSW